MLRLRKRGLEKDLPRQPLDPTPGEKKRINNIILLGISTAVTKELLEHSSPDLTNKDELLRREQVYRYNQIPAVLS